MVRDHLPFPRFSVFKVIPSIRSPLSAQGGPWCQKRQRYSLCSKHPHRAARRDNILPIIPSSRRHHQLCRKPHLLADRISRERKILHCSLLGQHARRSCHCLVLLLVVLEGYQGYQETRTHSRRTARAETQLAAIQRRADQDPARSGRPLELDR